MKQMIQLLHAKKSMLLASTCLVHSMNGLQNVSLVICTNPDICRFHIKNSIYSVNDEEVSKMQPYQIHNISICKGTGYKV